jgi:hypothetical protein
MPSLRSTAPQGRNRSCGARWQASPRRPTRCRMLGSRGAGWRRGQCRRHCSGLNRVAVIRQIRILPGHHVMSQDIGIGPVSFGTGGRRWWCCKYQAMMWGPWSRPLPARSFMQRRTALDSHEPSCRAPVLPHFRRNFWSSLQDFGYLVAICVSPAPSTPAKSTNHHPSSSDVDLALRGR